MQLTFFVSLRIQASVQQLSQRGNIGHGDDDSSKQRVRATGGLYMFCGGDSGQLFGQAHP